jgi:hypothetical protein
MYINMKRIIFIIFLLSQISTSFGQARFNRIYRFDSAQLTGTVCFSLGTYDNRIYLAGTGNVKFDSINYISYGFLSQFDVTTGNVTKKNYYGRQYESNQFFNNVMFIDKNSINLIGSNFDSSITFIKTGFDGEALIRKKYYPNDFPTSYYGNSASITKFERGYAFTTYKGFFTRTLTQASVLIIDTLGNITKTFDFKEDSLNCGPSTILINKNKNLTVSTFGAYGDDIDSNFTYISKIREIDTSGRVLWSYSTPRNKYIFADKFVQLSNGNYLMWGSEEVSRLRFTGIEWRRVVDSVLPYIAEINPQRGLIWEKKIRLETGARIYGLKILRDSSIVLTGHYNDGTNGTSAFLIRLNSRRDSLYRRNFRTPQFSERVIHYPNQIEELNNGDLLIGGYIMHSIPINQPTAGQWGWLVRTDNLGCSLQPSSCRVATKEIEKGPLSIKVFPNPAYNTINVEYDLVDKFEDAYISLFDFTGREIKRQKLVANQSQVQWQTDDLQTGLYLISIYADNRVVWKTKVSVQK